MTGQQPQGGVFSTDLFASTEGSSWKQGTSMASPHVAGVAALIASHFTGLSNEELISRLVNTADDIYDLNPSFIGNLGTGRINAFRALTEDPPPGRPELVFPGNDSEDNETIIIFNWDAAPLASSHDFELARDINFSDIVTSQNGLSQTSYEYRSLDIETTYYWRVRGVNSAGEGLWSPVSSFTTGSVVNIGNDGELPRTVTLDQNYPNPFNPSTQISYTLTEASDVALSVYNVNGQRVATLYNGAQSAGRHTFTFDAGNLASGVYIYQLRTNEMVLNRKMMLVK
jgi:hypothetical protein